MSPKPLPESSEQINDPERPHVFRYWIDRCRGAYRFVFPDMEEASFTAPSIDDGLARLERQVVECLSERLRTLGPRKPFEVPYGRPRAGEGECMLPLALDLKLQFICCCRTFGISASELSRRLKITPQEAQRFLKLSNVTKLDPLRRAFRAIGLDIAFSLTPMRLPPNLPPAPGIPDPPDPTVPHGMDVI